MVKISVIRRQSPGYDKTDELSYLLDTEQSPDIRQEIPESCLLLHTALAKCNSSRRTLELKEQLETQIWTKPQHWQGNGEENLHYRLWYHMQVYKSYRRLSSVHHVAHLTLRKFLALCITSPSTYG